MNFLIAGIGILAVSASPPSLHLVEKARSRQFDVVVSLDADVGAAEELSLWYTVDDGGSWQLYETRRVEVKKGVGEVRGDVAAKDSGGGPVGDSGRVAFSFRADGQGLHGFYVVARNSFGASGGAPDLESMPHLWVYVDFAAPVLQLHESRLLDAAREPREVAVSWSAVDFELKRRGISLSYQLRGESGWRTIELGIGNTGRYVWRLGTDVVGEVMVRVMAEDLGGHVVEARSEWFDVSPSAAVLMESEPVAVARDDARRSRLVESSGRRGSVDREVDRAEALYRQGVDHAARQEYRLASSRLRDALALDPSMGKALVELGRVLYLSGDVEGSVEAYELALRQTPGSRDAMEGLALNYLGQRQFEKAVRELSQMVRSNPRDAKAWLNLGDVAIYQGDEVLARQHYEKAMTVDPRAEEVIRHSRIRMADLQRLAAEFRQTEEVWPARPR